MELSDRQLEAVARAFRDTLYIKPQEDPQGWVNCRDNWIKDVSVFQGKLAKLGLEIVPVKKPMPDLGGPDKPKPS